jgi:hypothetical protein
MIFLERMKKKKKKLQLMKMKKERLKRNLRSYQNAFSSMK